VLGLPVLVGASRKSLLGKLTGRAVGDRLAGSVALATVAVMHGARIIRAHDVAATVDAVRIASAVLDGVAMNQERLT
jgi:dihydropteroate synthase